VTHVIAISFAGITADRWRTPTTLAVAMVATDYLCLGAALRPLEAPTPTPTPTPVASVSGNGVEGTPEP